MEYFNHSRTRTHSLIWSQNKAEKSVNCITIQYRYEAAQLLLWRFVASLHKNCDEVLLTPKVPSLRSHQTVSWDKHYPFKLRRSSRSSMQHFNYISWRSWVLISGRIPAILTVFILVFFSPLESDSGTVPEMWPLPVSFTSYPNQYTIIIFHRTLHIISHRVSAYIINI
jgi:hypothetical protein